MRGCVYCVKMLEKPQGTEQTMNALIKPMETSAETDGKGYVHWKSWQETYTGLIDQHYLDTRSLERCIRTAHQWPDRILIAKDGEKVIGFTGYGPYRDDSLSDTGEIYALYVLQEYQHQGVGYALMNAAIQQLAAYSRLALWVLDGNEPAIRFYERCGFRFDGVSQELLLGTPVLERRMIIERNQLTKE